MFALNDNGKQRFDIGMMRATHRKVGIVDQGNGESRDTRIGVAACRDMVSRDFMSALLIAGIKLVDTMASSYTRSMSEFDPTGFSLVFTFVGSLRMLGWVNGVGVANDW